MSTILNFKISTFGSTNDRMLSFLTSLSSRDSPSVQCSAIILYYGNGTITDYLGVEGQDHVWKASELEKYKENKMAGQVMPQKLGSCFRHTGLILFRSLHGYDYQVN